MSVSVRSVLPTIARTLLGLGFLVFGLNFFLHFLPPPAPPPADALTFLGALVTGKILTIVKLTEIAAGALLVVNRFPALALALLAPLEVGIFTFHAVFEPSGLGIIVALIALTVYLAWSYRDAFAPMLRARVEPAAATALSGTRASSVAARA